MSLLIAYSPLAEPQGSEVAENGVMIDHGTMTNTSEGDPAASTVSNLARTAAEATARINRTRQFAKQYMEECGFSLCPIAKGSKGPKSKGWQNKPLTQNMIGDHGLGLIHTLSGTCAIDLDDLQAAEAWFGARGIELRDLLADDDAVQIISGRPNRTKLLYRLPEGVKPLVTKQIKSNGAMIIEFRCAPSDGDGCQDVLPPTIHPKTGAEYKWGGAGDFTKLPVLPDALLNAWVNDAAPVAILNSSTSESSLVIVEGGRNLTLFKLAGDLVAAGMAEESIRAALIKENEIKCVDPLPLSEVETIVRSALKSSQGALRLAQQEALEKARLAAVDARLKVQAKQNRVTDFLARLPSVMQQIGAWYQNRAFYYQETFVLPIALAACGAVLARDFTSQGQASTNMYWVLIAPTATGKEAALRCVNDIVTVYGDQRRAGAPTSQGGVLAALERNPASCLVIDELGEYLKGVFDLKAAGFKAAIGPILMDLYTKGGTEFLGQEYAKQTGPDARKRADIKSPCPSIFGATTPSTFYAALSAATVDNGFLPRLLPFRAPDRVPTPNFVQKEEPVPAVVIEWLETIKSRVALRQKELGVGGDLRGVQSYCPVHVPFSAEALELRNAHMLAICERRNSGVDGLASNMMSRTVENAGRVALTLALADNPHATEVGVEHLQLALDIVSYAADVFLNDMRKNVFDSKFAELETKVLEYIKKYYIDEKCGVAEGTLSDRCRSYKNATQSQRKAVIEALEGQGRITRDKTQKDSWRFTPTLEALQ
ncbi:DUF3987 domain-containing protein [Massilia oculi]|uniref:DUF3987 domain-containing protein n=1 Tax=Massilia hydrophila TaxID=3044279 RepID=A0ABS7Y7Y0_9BURK|nr:DUF3987 domain-containing protein [Massilia oculi]MCA1854439.1 DUF3987 domain-containing protein [Massilia oculi]